MNTIATALMPSASAASRSRAHRGEIGLLLDRAVGAHALVDLDHALEQHFGLDDLLGEDLRPRLVADAQRVAETFRGHQQRALALALEQRVGGDRGAHLHGADAAGRDRLALRSGRAGRGCPARRRRDRPPGFSDSSLCAVSVPSGRRPTTSVKVPPRSIQKSHACVMFALVLDCRRGRPGVTEYDLCRQAYQTQSGMTIGQDQGRMVRLGSAEG